MSMKMKMEMKMRGRPCGGGGGRGTGGVESSADLVLSGDLIAGRPCLLLFLTQRADCSSPGLPEATHADPLGFYSDPPVIERMREGLRERLRERESMAGQLS
jgi:hypothetical protein